MADRTETTKPEASTELADPLDVLVMCKQEKREICPDCKRLKARNAYDCINGDCDKWYAIRDKEAHQECAQVTKDLDT